MSRLGPPRLALRLIAAAVRSPLAREGVLGDLEERYAVRCTRGRWRADGWFWRESVAVVVRYAWERRTVPGPGRGERAPLTALRRDGRDAWRALWARPLLTLVVTGTMAVGIGANTLLFSVVNAVVLKPLPYPNSERLTVLWTDYDRLDGNRPAPAMSGPDYFDYREQTALFDDVGAAWGYLGGLAGDGHRAESVQRVGVTANFLPMLGVSPALGRLFTVHEDVPGGPRLAILSHDLWRRRYGADSSMIGRTIQLDGESHTVIGVMPRTFRLWIPPETMVWHAPVDIWLPLQYDRSTQPRGRRHLLVVGRLGTEATLEQARAEARRIAAGIRERFEQYQTATGLDIRPVPLHRDVTGDVRPALMAMWAAVAFVLLIVVANVSNLLLGHAVARQPQFALRAVLGETRAQVFRRLLAESLGLAALGAVGGVGLAVLGLRGIQWGHGALLPRLESATVDPLVVAFAVMLTVAVGLASGWIPARRAMQASPQELMQARGRLTVRSGGLRALVIVQVTVSLALLVGAGLMARTVAAVLAVHPGFDPRDVLTFRVDLPTTTHPEDAQRVDFFRRLEERLAALPGVDAVGGINTLPFTGRGTGWRFTRGDVTGAMDYWSATPSYFAAMGARILAGRTFDWSRGADGRVVAVVDETLARRIWADPADAVGETVQFGDVDVEVVGVVEHVRSRQVTLPPQPQAYVPYHLQPWNVFFALRAEAPLTLAAPVVDVMQQLNPNIPVANVRLMSELVAQASAPVRLIGGLFALFAGVAMVLALLGLYAVLTHLVGSRRREVGIRLALGADAAGIVRLVLREGLLLVAGGIGLGLLAAASLTRFMRDLLFGVEPLDPLTYLAVSALFVGVALGACLLPARRAAAVDPAVTLRE